MAGNISDQTTVLSNLSLTGNLSASTLTGNVLSPLMSVSTLTVTGAFYVGAGTGQIKRFSQGTFAVAAITAVATKSTTTDAAISGMSTTDVVMVTPTASGLSNGLSLDVWVSAVDTLTLSFSNCSTVNAVQAAGTYKWVAVR